MPENLTQAVSTAQVAARLGVSVRTIHRMIGDGQLAPSMKVPGRTGAYLFDPAEVDRFERERSVAVAESVPAG